MNDLPHAPQATRIMIARMRDGLDYQWRAMGIAISREGVLWGGRDVFHLVF